MRVRETIGIALGLGLVFLFTSMIARAYDKVDIAICNGDESCLQLMKLGKIDEEIKSAREDLKMASQSLSYMHQYSGMWPNTEETRDWYQTQREFVCTTNNRMRQEIIPQIIRELNSMHDSRNSRISNQANLKIQEIQHDNDISFFTTEVPCNKATELCQKFL